MNRGRGIRIIANMLLSLLLLPMGCEPPLPPTSQLPPRLPLGRGSPPLNYTIDVELIPSSQRLSGRLELSFVNLSTRPVSRLPFHLYLNAFSGPDTLFAKSSGGVHRGHEAHEKGWIRVTEARIGHRRVLPQRRHDGTVMELETSGPVAPGAAIQVTLRFEAKLPRVYARTGFANDFFFVGQWYPKLGFLHRDGRWHCPPFHSNSEFYARFANYRVQLRLPPRYVVGATGVQTARRVLGATQQLSYRATWVHDFAFTAWPHFAERRAMVGPIAIRLLSPPARAGNIAQRQLALIRYGLHTLGAWFGSYPYPALTVVDVPLMAHGAAAMEYPTLFTVSRPLSTPPTFHASDEITLHELTHQYFHGIVATNESQEPWLDEGLTTFVSGLLLDHWLGEKDSVLHLGPLRLGQRHKNLLHAARTSGNHPLNQSAQQLGSWQNYASTVYGKTATLFYRLSDLMGRERLLRALRAYVQRYAFHHPTGSQLQASLLTHTPPELHTTVRHLLKRTIEHGVSLNRLRAPMSKGRPVQAYQLLPLIHHLIQWVGS